MIFQSTNVLSFIELNVAVVLGLFSIVLLSSSGNLLPFFSLNSKAACLSRPLGYTSDIRLWSRFSRHHASRERSHDRRARSNIAPHDSSRLCRLCCLPFLP